ncbi:DICT sensory domain-containing protein [Allokutzneria oryzae]|uniref:DICT sensory domain-containing protein n=1 Tax=Allokutzneria oryzae TaxID=1378989 RepID=A0ABV5ZRL5_9PSEU
MTHDELPPRTGTLTKRALVLASHAVERAALAAADDGLLVIALFQRLPYFERERRVYAELARHSACTVVGMVDRTRPDLPVGVTPVLLREDEDLAHEWSVIALSPTFGASVVARDLERVETRSTSLEAARLFQGRWGFRRDEAYAEAVRLRDTLGDRLPPSARNAIERVLDSVVDDPATAVEQRAEAALRHLVTRLEHQRRRYLDLREKVDADRGFGRDPWTGLHSLSSLGTWLGVTAPDTLPLGLALVRVPDLASLEARHGARTSMHTENNIADVLRREQRQQDRAFRISKTEFLLAQPGVDAAAIEAIGRRLGERVRGLGACYPFVGVCAEVATTISRTRPLPLEELRSRLGAPNAVPMDDRSWETAPIPVVRAATVAAED